MSGAYPHIACCVDLSHGSARALAEARRLRALGPGRLTVLHVLEVRAAGTVRPDATVVMGESRDGAQAWLTDLLGEDEHGVLLDHEYPPRAVCDWAAGPARPDLLVAGAFRGALERAMHGGFATHLAYHAPCFVLLVRP